MLDIQAISSGSKGNCYRISDGSSSLLLECGISFRQIQQGINFETSSLVGVLVTHEHLDHCKSVNQIASRGIDVYMTAGTKAGLVKNGTIQEVNNRRIHTVEALKQFTIGDWTILPFDVQHDAKEPVGFLIANKNGAKLLFATDTYYIKYKFKGLTHLLVEVNYSEQLMQRNVSNDTVHPVLADRIRASHFSLENYLTFLKANDLSQLQEIHVIHLSETNGDETLFKREIQKATGRMVVVH